MPLRWTWHPFLPGIKKQTYEKKASEHLAGLTKWLRENLLQCGRSRLSRFAQEIRPVAKGIWQRRRIEHSGLGQRCRLKVPRGTFHKPCAGIPAFFDTGHIRPRWQRSQAAQEALRGIVNPLVPNRRTRCSMRLNFWMATSSTPPNRAMLVTCSVLEGQRPGPGAKSSGDPHPLSPASNTSCLTSFVSNRFG